MSFLKCLIFLFTTLSFAKVPKLSLSSSIYFKVAFNCYPVANEIDDNQISNIIYLHSKQSPEVIMILGVREHLHERPQIIRNANDHYLSKDKCSKKFHFQNTYKTQSSKLYGPFIAQNKEEMPILFTDSINLKAGTAIIYFNEMNYIDFQSNSGRDLSKDLVLYLFPQKNYKLKFNSDSIYKFKINKEPFFFSTSMDII